MLATVLNTIQIGIVCLQETKSTCTDHIRSLNWHFYLSGDADDPHAGVGFAVPQYLLPLVHDFIPLTARIAILKLATKPFPISLFSVYAPSQVSCEQEDLDRKEAFWRSLYEWYMHFSPHTYPIIMGDFNTRLYANQLEGLDRHIGPVTFSPPTEADLAQNNFTYMLQFLVQNGLCIISSMRPRPPSKLITYREIADLTNDPTRPTIGNFAVLDHVVTPFQYRTFFRSILSVPSLPLPGFIGITCLQQNLLLQISFIRTPRLLRRHFSLQVPPRNMHSTLWSFNISRKAHLLLPLRSTPNPYLILFVFILTAHAQISITSAPATLLAGAYTSPTHIT